MYDGGTVATVNTTDDRVSGDVFDILRTASYADKNVSLNKAVSVSGVSLSDPSSVTSIDAGNYTVVSTGSTAAAITARPLTLTYSGVNKVYDGLLGARVTTDPTAANGYVSGDVLSVNRTATFVDKNVGNVGINVTGVSLSGTDAANYQVVGANGVATTTGTTSANITPKTLSAALVGSIQKTYDGNTNATLGTGNYSLTGFVTVNGVTEGATVTQTAGTYNNRNVLLANRVDTTLASGDFTANNGTDLSNYTLPTAATGAGSIGVRTLTVGYTGVNRDYNGSTVATVTTTDNRVTGDVFDINRSASFDTKNTGSAKPISVYSVSLSDPAGASTIDASNYIVASTGSTSANVTRLDSVTWVGGASGEWFNPANWAVTGHLTQTGVVPDLNNVRTVLVPSGTNGAAISFDDSVAGRSAGALSGIVLVDSITNQDSVALSNLNFKNGSLVVTNNATLGGFESAAGTTLTVGGTLSVDIASGTTKTMAGLLNGAGNVRKAGAGTWVLTGGSAYTGTTTISAGTLQVGNATTSGNLGSGDIINNATLVFKRSNAIGIANVISGSGELKQEGAGALTLSGANTYTGATYVNAGSLAISSDSNLGAAPTSAQAAQLVVNNASVYFYPAFTTATSANRGLTLVGSSTLNTAAGSSVTWAGPITGTALTKLGDGTLILGGNNSYAATTVSAGTLQIGNGSTTGSLGTGAVSVVSNLAFNRSDDTTVSNAISGAGTLSKLGSNTLTLTGVQTYTGATDVAGGLVFQNDAMPTTSGFTGAGFVRIEPMSAGFASAVTTNYTYANTLTGLTLGNAGNTQAMTVGSAVNIAGPITVYGGSVTTNAALTSSATGAGVLLKALGKVNTGANLTTTGGDITLWANSGGASTGGIVVNNGTTLSSGGGWITLGGSVGSISGLPASSTLGTALPQGYAKNANSITGLSLGTSVGAVSQTSNVTFTTSGGRLGMAGESSVYALSGSDRISFGLVAYNGVNINTGSGDLVGYGLTSGTPSGGNSFTAAFQLQPWASTQSTGSTWKTNGGNIILTGLSTVSGSAESGRGLLMDGTATAPITIENTSASSGSVTFNGAVTGSPVSSRYDLYLTQVNVLSASGDIHFNANTAGSTFTFAGIAKVGQAASSDVTASTSNITIIADKVNVSAAAALGTTGAVTLEPYSDAFASAVSLPSNLSVSSSATSFTLGKTTNTANVTVATALSINGPIRLYGGNLTLNAALTTTNASTGDVLLRGADVNGAYGISLADGRTLTVDNTGTNSILSGVISGTGVSLSKLGAGVLTLTGNNTYTGGTSIDTVSTLVAGNAATSGVLGTGGITNNGVLSFKRSDAITVADVISGTGIVKQEGTGTLTLSGTNAYEGGTQVNAGTLAISIDRNVGAVPAMVDPDNITLNGGTLRFLTGFTTLHANRGITLGAGNGTLSTDASVTANYNGVIAGTAGLTKSGSGTLTLTNVQTYTGTTTISGGTLNVGDGSDALAALGANTLSIGTGATLNFNHSADVTVANAISGAGQLNKLDINTLTLTGMNSYTGATGTGSAGGMVFTNNTAPATSGFTGASTVTIEPASTSFGSLVTGNYTYANTLTGLTLGKVGNLTNVILNSLWTLLARSPCTRRKSR